MLTPVDRLSDNRLTKRPRICFVVATPLTATVFLRDHIVALNEHYDVDLIADVTDSALLGDLTMLAHVISVPIRRRVSPVLDMYALLALWSIFVRRRPTVVHTLTPKAGLIGQAAAWLARVSVRCHTFTGQVWVTRRGMAQQLLKAVDRLIASLATHILVDSPSQCEFIIAESILPSAKAQVLGDGAVCGVDAGRFRPNAIRRAEVRQACGIPDNAVVFLFLGRLTRDKGVIDLARAFNALDEACAWLLFVGPDEEILAKTLRNTLGSAAARTVMIDYTEFPEDYMAAADVFCLPSYREGFGMAIIEAAATGLPAIASRIYGITDAVVEGGTGLLHPPRDCCAIASAMGELIRDPSRRFRLGALARQRALTRFSKERLSGYLVSYYRDRLVHE